MIATSEGWGVLGDDGIDMRTVSDTRRAAIVNWLCATGACLVHRGTTDERIEQIWQQSRGTAEAVPVRVQAVVSAN